MPRYNSYSLKRFLPIILIVVVIIIAVLILVSVLRSVFLSSDDKKPDQNINVIQNSLLNTEADRSVRLVVRGPIVADEDFSSYRITVSPSSRVAQSFSGYLNELKEEKSLGNNTRAYEEFVHALHLADLDRGVQFEGDRNDIRGVCATGRVYEFSFLKDDKVSSTLWTSTCSGSPGSLKANAEQLTSLFMNQIPDAKSITGNITASSRLF